MNKLILFLISFFAAYTFTFAQADSTNAVTTSAEAVSTHDVTMTDSTSSSRSISMAAPVVDTTTIATSQSCAPQNLIDSCLTQLKDDNFIDIKTFTVQNKGGESEVEFTYTFTAGTTYEYYFTCSENLIVSLYDMNKKNLVASNKKSPHKIVFDCEKTGVHYVHFAFKNTDPFCGAAILGFTKKR
ncbi:MAG: hypothetical protein GY827_11735 [Cytophagales bacterium]|nr:hypothetical protein [Cytophagales bacterium]